MRGMRLDHVSYAAGPDGLAATADRLGAALGESFHDGGVHPRFGTRNMLLPLAGGQYIEVVAVLDHPASDKVPFGKLVRDRSEEGGGWLCWVVAVDDITEVEHRLGRHAVPGNRRQPDGFDLRWLQIGVKGLHADPQLPFVVQWEAPASRHPSAGASGEIWLQALEIAGSQDRLEQWLGSDALTALADVEVDWVAQHGQPGIVAVHVGTPSGSVRL